MVWLVRFGFPQGKCIFFFFPASISDMRSMQTPIEWVPGTGFCSLVALTVIQCRSQEWCSYRSIHTPSYVFITWNLIKRKELIFFCIWQLWNLHEHTFHSKLSLVQQISLHRHDASGWWFARERLPLDSVLLLLKRTAVNGFRKSGISPLNHNAFMSHDFSTQRKEGDGDCE
jgi:hypothetical protein